MFAEEELLPLSGLQHMSYCERRWALVELERHWEENVFTAQGELLHQNVHSGSIESRPGTLIRRTVPLRSLRLGLSGQADVVEFLPCTASQKGIVIPRRKGRWFAYPVEYKRSLDKRRSEAYTIQLCAQALCLEEMLDIPVPEGALFDGQKRRRHEVSFTPALRSAVEHLATKMHRIHGSGVTPGATYNARRCDSCSLAPVCLPEVLGGGSASAWLRRCVNASLSQSAGEDKEDTG